MYGNILVYFCIDKFYYSSISLHLDLVNMFIFRTYTRIYTLVLCATCIVHINHLHISAEKKTGWSYCSVKTFREKRCITYTLTIIHSFDSIEHSSKRRSEESCRRPSQYFYDVVQCYTCDMRVRCAFSNSSKILRKKNHVPRAKQVKDVFHASRTTVWKITTQHSTGCYAFVSLVTSGKFKRQNKLLASNGHVSIYGTILIFYLNFFLMKMQKKCGMEKEMDRKWSNWNGA